MNGVKRPCLDPVFQEMLGHLAYLERRAVERSTEWSDLESDVIILTKDNHREVYQEISLHPYNQDVGCVYINALNTVNYLTSQPPNVLDGKSIYCMGSTVTSDAGDVLVLRFAPGVIQVDVVRTENIPVNQAEHLVASLPMCYCL